MADENVKILRIDTGESEQTVKGLKEEIKDLRDAILNLEEGTDEYDKTVKQLQADQRKLDDVMSLTKKTATALDGSYDSLVFQMSKLKKEWRATNDEAKRNELGKQISEINTKLKGMDEEIGNYQRNVGNYTNSICDAFERLQAEISEFENKAAEAYQTGDAKAYADAIEEIGRRQTVIDQINQDSDMMNGTLEKRMEGLTSLASGVAGGFAAVQGVLALCGTESEEFEKVMVKLSAAMAIVQGVAGIAGMVKGMKSLISLIKAMKLSIQSLMASTGVGAIAVAAIAAITAIIGTINSLISKSKEAQKELAKMQAQFADSVADKSKEQIRTLNSLSVAWGRLGGDMKAQEKFITDNRDKFNELGVAIRNVADAENILIDNKDKFILSIIAKNKALAAGEIAAEKYKEAMRKQLELNDIPQQVTKYQATGTMFMPYSTTSWQEDNPDYIQAEQEIADLNAQADELVKAQFAFTDEEKKLLEQIGVVSVETQDTVDEQTLKYLEMKKNLADAMLDFRKGIDDEMSKLENEDIKVEDVKIDPDEGQGEVVKGVDNAVASKELTARKEMNDAILLSDEERARREIEIQTNLNNEKLRLINEGIQSAIDANDLESLAELIQERADIELEIERQKNEELKRLREEDEQNQIERQEKAKQITDASLKTMSNALGATANLYQSLAEAKVKSGKMSEVEYKKEMKKVKSIQIAQAVISTLASSIEAFRAMAGIPIVGPALGGVAAASAVAMGIAQIAKIKSTDIGGGSTPNMSTPDVGGGNGNVMPDERLIENLFEPEPQRNITGEKETEELNQAQKVYILESDIQDSGRKVQVREDETTF